MTDQTTRAIAWPPRTIVVAVDFGEASARAVGIAGFIATAGSATLRVLHAERFEVPPYFTPAQIERLDRHEGDAGDAGVAHRLEGGQVVRVVPRHQRKPRLGGDRRCECRVTNDRRGHNCRILALH